MRYLLLFLLFISSFSYAQNYDYLDGNNIQLRIYSNGSAGSGTTPQYDGYSHVLFPTYETLGLLSLNVTATGDSIPYLASMNDFYNADFSYGPVSDSSNSFFDRVWKITREKVNYHIQHCFDAGYFPDSSIYYWPAHGNTAAGEAFYLAPYFDYNDDGFYDSQSGDYPLFPGDVCVLSISNDKTNHPATGGTPMNVEVQTFYYLYLNTGYESVDNTVFVNSTIINRSGLVLNNVSSGISFFGTIGQYFDDGSGIDSLRNTVFHYNIDSLDYLSNPVTPANCLRLLNGDFSSFMERYHGATVPQMMQFPENDSALFFNNEARWSNGDSLLYGGCGNVATSYTGPFTNLMFTGSLQDTLSWTYDDCAYYTYLYSMPSVLHGLLSAQDTIELSYALIYAPDNGGTHIDAVDLCLAYSDMIQEYFNTVVNDVSEYARGNTLKLYPNPANDVLQFGFLREAEYTVSVFDLSGKLVFRQQLYSGENSLNVSSLKSGLYILSAQSDDEILMGRFVKQ